MTATDTDDPPEFSRWSPGHERPDRRQQAMPSTMTFVAVITLVFGIASSLVAAGYNWRAVIEVKESHDKLVTEVERNYVRKDVDAKGWQVVETQLEELKAQMVVMQRALERRAKD